MDRSRATSDAVGQVRCAGSPLPVTPPTLADVAERAGVSRQTVSNAVNNPDLLRPDTLARVQEAIDELGYSPNRAARNLRTRASHLIGLRFEPAQEGTANATMDRFVHSLVETVARGRLPRAAVRRATTERPDRRATTTCCARPPSTPSSSPTPTSATRRPPGCRSGGRRSSPSAGRGTTPSARHPWVDVDGAAGTELGHRAPARAGPPPDRLDRLAQGLPHRRGPPLRLDPRDARPRPVDHRARLAGRGHRRVAAARRAPYLLDEAAAHRRSSAPPTPSRWGCCTPCATAVCAPARDIAVVGFDDSQVAQVVPPGLTSVRQPLEQVAVEIVPALEGLLAHPPASGAGRAAHADPRRTRVVLARRETRNGPQNRVPGAISRHSTTQPRRTLTVVAEAARSAEPAYRTCTLTVPVSDPLLQRVPLRRVRRGGR